MKRKEKGLQSTFGCLKNLRVSTRATFQNCVILSEIATSTLFSFQGAQKGLGQRQVWSIEQVKARGSKAI